MKPNREFTFEAMGPNVRGMRVVTWQQAACEALLKQLEARERLRRQLVQEDL